MYSKKHDEEHFLKVSPFYAPKNSHTINILGSKCFYNQSVETLMEIRESEQVFYCYECHIDWWSSTYYISLIFLKFDLSPHLLPQARFFLHFFYFCFFVRIFLPPSPILADVICEWFLTKIICFTFGQLLFLWGLSHYKFIIFITVSVIVKCYWRQWQKSVWSIFFITLLCDCNFLKVYCNSLQLHSRLRGRSIFFFWDWNTFGGLSQYFVIIIFI